MRYIEREKERNEVPSLLGSELSDGTIEIDRVRIRLDSKGLLTERGQ